MFIIDDILIFMMARYKASSTDNPVSEVADRNRVLHRDFYRNYIPSRKISESRDFYRNYIPSRKICESNGAERDVDGPEDENVDPDVDHTKTPSFYCG